MLKRVLIANRGEIALRILRACRESGMETVAVYSTADEKALHVQLATQSVCIGPAAAGESYLNQNALLAVAKATGCDGVHPGYGFLSENADFADACRKAGLTFIGPGGDVIRRAGDKAAARKMMRAAGVPVTPGSDGPVETVHAALSAAHQVGYPVLLKASAGGGGRGIRRCDNDEQLESAYQQAKAVGYESAGTVEFLLDETGEHFYFMEMNARIQVEHGITEMTTGVDLVREQLRIASGLPLSIRQEDIRLSGHAIECRINAEDPQQDFRPAPGPVEFIHFPGGNGVRVDSGLFCGSELSPYYDSLVAKVMAQGRTRLEAIRRMRRCLEEFALEGFATNAELSYQILYHPAFIRGNCSTAFLEENLAQLLDFSRRAGDEEEQL
ncbi:MAG: acetyl/propionyl/methylcrotonyl-CoA carboxylase subunit alpha [Candidatus Ventricola sp.]